MDTDDFPLDLATEGNSVATPEQRGFIFFAYGLMSVVCLGFGIGYLLLGTEPLWFRLGVLSTQWVPIAVLFLPKSRVSGEVFLGCFCYLLTATAVLFWTRRYLPVSISNEDYTLYLMLGIVTAIGTFDLHTAIRGTVDFRKKSKKR